MTFGRQIKKLVVYDGGLCLTGVYIWIFYLGAEN